MAPVWVDPHKVRAFENAECFNDWFARHHDTNDELWVKIHKVASGLRSITPKEAIDVALCWGWIDGIGKSFDDKSYLKRFTARRPRSIWSAINVASVERLMAHGRMTEHGLREVEAAKSDGRWDRSYASGKGLKIPDDLSAAIDAEPEAKAMLATLTEQSRFSLAFRMHNLKTDKGRKNAIAAITLMLKRGEAGHPRLARQND